MCKYCKDTHVIEDWREWLRAARDIELAEMKSRGWTWKSMLSECRQIRDGFDSRIMRRRVRAADCICCE